MDKQTAQNFRNDFQKAIAELEEKYSAKIELGTIRFDHNTFTARLSYTEKPKNGKSIEMVEFEKNCYHYNLKPIDYGKTFTTNHGQFILIGIKPRSTKYPILGECPMTGKQYKFMRNVLNNLQ